MALSTGDRQIGEVPGFTLMRGEAGGGGGGGGPPRRGEGMG